MPIWFAAIPWILGAARVAVPIAIRSAGTIGRTGSTIIRHRRTIATGASASIQPSIYSGDLPDITRTGLINMGLSALADAVGNSKSSASGNRKTGSGRPKSSGVGIVDPRQGGYRPNNRPGGYMPRF